MANNPAALIARRDQGYLEYNGIRENEAPCRLMTILSDAGQDDNHE